MNDESKPRIGVVISDCLKCKHCEQYSIVGKTFGFLLLCGKENEVVYRDDYARNLNEISKKEFIPEWCPLDCYSGDNEIYDIKKKNDKKNPYMCNEQTPYVRYK